MTTAKSEQRLSVVQFGRGERMLFEMQEPWLYKLTKVGLLRSKVFILSYFLESTYLCLKTVLTSRLNANSESHLLSATLGQPARVSLAPSNTLVLRSSFMHKTQFDLHTIVDISYSFSYDFLKCLNINRFAWKLKRGNFCSRLSPKPFTCT